MSKTRLRDIDRKPLEIIMENEYEKALMFASLIAHIRQSAHFAKNPLQNMKLLTILTILYKTVHRNNDRYLLLLIALYMYLAGAHIDAITLINHLGVTVS